MSTMLVYTGKDFLGSGNTEYIISTNTLALFTTQLTGGVVTMNISRVRVEYLRVANHKHIAVSHYQNSTTYV